MNTNNTSARLTRYFGWAFTAFVICFQPLAAQETITTTGGTATGSGGTATFTIGQPFYQTHQGEGGSVAEGVQQPYEIYLVTSVDDAPLITLSMKVFPNPVAERLQLVVDDTGDLSAAGYRYRLFDVNGRELISDRIVSRQTDIDMGELPTAIYLMHVLDSRQSLKVFRIIKN